MPAGGVKASCFLISRSPRNHVVIGKEGGTKGISAFDSFDDANKAAQASPTKKYVYALFVWPPSEKKKK